jgi:hypothetical protein
MAAGGGDSGQVCGGHVVKQNGGVRSHDGDNGRDGQDNQTAMGLFYKSHLFSPCVEMA